MKILGIDPGTATTGFGIIEFDGYGYQMIEFGCIKTEKHFSLAERIGQLTSDLNQLINEFNPDEVGIEELFFNNNVKTGIQVAQARGAILNELSRRGLKAHGYTPQQVKSNVCGYGHAKKDQIQKMVQIILNLKEIPKPDDAADALAIAICHANFTKQNFILT